MARRNKRNRSGVRAACAVGNIQLRETTDRYESARRLAMDGNYDDARALYAEMHPTTNDPKLRAIIANDLATLDVIAGNFESAHKASSQPSSSINPASPPSSTSRSYEPN